LRKLKINIQRFSCFYNQ